MGIEPSMPSQRNVIGGVIGRSSCAITRPANTTDYASGDIWSDSTSTPTTPELENVARIAGLSGALTDLMVMFSGTTARAFWLYLFREAVTIDNDNAAFSPTYAELQTLVTLLDSANANSFVTAGGIVYVFEKTRTIKCAAGDASLYPVIELRGAYTPESAEVATIVLSPMQD